MARAALAGSQGAEQAMRAMEFLQLDPLQILARSHDIQLHSRVLDTRPGTWEELAYQQRKFFDWGGWLAARPMDELPHWRVVMRREREGGPDCDPRIRQSGIDHAEAIDEMRAILRERGTVSNRDFAMATRTRTESYRGRKDSALALYYMWRTGEVMTHHRENFERVYALSETVAPAHLLRESDEAEADRFLILKEASFSGLSRLNRTAEAFHRGTPFSKAKHIFQALLADGDLIPVQVEGWKAVHYALGSDAELLSELSAGHVPQAWQPLECGHDGRGHLPVAARSVSARGRAKVLFGFDYIWEVYKPLHSTQVSATTHCRFCGVIGLSRASTANSTARPIPLSSSASGWRIRHWATIPLLRRHWRAVLRASPPFSVPTSSKCRRFKSRFCAKYISA